MDEKALNYLSLARKAGRIELGEEPVGAAVRAGRGCLVLVAADAAEHTWRRGKGFVAGTGRPCVRVPFSKDQLGQAIGRTSLAMAAFTDPAMALAFLSRLEKPESYREAVESLDRRTRRERQRQTEEKAHLRNKRQGRTRREPGKKQS